jgi:hypothetical protein
MAFAPEVVGPRDVEQRAAADGGLLILASLRRQLMQLVLVPAPVLGLRLYRELIEHTHRE